MSIISHIYPRNSKIPVFSCLFLLLWLRKKFSVGLATTRYFQSCSNKNQVVKNQAFRSILGIKKAILPILLVIFSGLSEAVPVQEGYAQLIEYLAAEKTHLNIDIHNAKLWTFPKNESVILSELDKVKQAIISNEVEQETLERFLATQRASLEDLSKELDRTQYAAFDWDQKSNVQENINRLIAERDANYQTIVLIEEDLRLITHYRALLIRRQTELALKLLTRQTEVKLEVLHDKIHHFEQKRAALYENNIRLLRAKTTFRSDDNRLRDDLVQYYTNQRISMIDDAITSLRNQMERVETELKYAKNKDITTLEELLHVIEHGIVQNQRILKAWPLWANHMCIQEPIVSVRQECQLTANMHDDLVTMATEELTLLNEALTERQTLLRKKLAARQSLSDFSWQVGVDIIHQVAYIPFQWYAYLASILGTIVEQYSWNEALQNFLCALLAFLIVSSGVFFSRSMRKWIQKKGFIRVNMRMSTQLLDGLFVLIHRNILQLTGIVLLATLLYMNQVPYVHYRLLMHLIGVWFMTRQCILIARLALYERVTDTSGHDVVLYRRLKGLLIAGGVSTALMIYGHAFPLSFLLQDIFDRLFMLFIVAVSWILWKSHDMLDYVFPAVLVRGKPHLRHAVVVLSWCVPITLLTTGLLGIIGYINLAWTMSRYEAYLLSFIVAYVLLRGVARDAFDYSSEWMVARLHNGWLWVEALLKPLDKVVQVVLFMMMVLGFLSSIGLMTDPTFQEGVQSIAYYPLVHLADTYITVLRVLESFVLLLFFIWATKWSREFCYRWLYLQVADLGVRNSLSVFTQYGVVVLGGFATLKVLGIDFTGIMVVLGGFAVGMGFGLRDFASNIIGGLMLLIERPVREGDLVTIGEHEGRVAHIGIRSMRVSSWDNMEVLIPNAETYNKPFTNWTHQDSIVRSVVPIKVSRMDSPELVQSMIYDVLADIPEILDTPAPQVYLKEIDDALLAFEVRYFVNVQLHTRFEVRSKALLLIMKEFKKRGVKAPIPPVVVALQKPDEHD